LPPISASAGQERTSGQPDAPGFSWEKPAFRRSTANPGTEHGWTKQGPSTQLQIALKPLGAAAARTGTDHHSARFVSRLRRCTSALSIVTCDCAGTLVMARFSVEGSQALHSRLSALPRAKR